jgi:TPR repeat protein
VTNVTFSRVVLAVNSVALGLGLLLLAAPKAVLAADPDIPRLQAYAQRGSIKEEVELGAAYFAGRGVHQDEKLAAYWYEKAANAGDPVAQKQIGYFYEAGIGVERDPAQAARWFERAVAGGLISAKVNLGVAYLLGDGVKKDTQLAENLFKQAFAQRNGMAACYLGEMYINGMGVERDEAAGERWYEVGAKLHDPRAQFQLANLLWHRGKDANDLKKAVRLLRESGAAGMVAAKHQLAVILLKHPELASAQEAPALFKEASEAGEWRSSVALGLIWRDGMAGVRADPKNAYYHYRLAALQGGQEALQVVQNELDALSDRLGTEQTARLDADAKSWFENHHLALQFVNKDGWKWKEYPAYAVVHPEDGTHAGRLIPLVPSAGFMEAPVRRLSAN